MATWVYTVGPGYYYNHYQLTGNALNVKNYLEARGFSPGAIIGILANMEHESYMNPGQQEHGYGGSPARGYGLVQWTPASSKILAYAQSIPAAWYDGDVQMDFLMINAPQSWGMAYQVTWDQYKLLNDIYYATKVFFYNFERGTWADVMYDYAAYWFNYLYGETPPQPPDPPTPPPPTPPGPGDDVNNLLLALKLAKVLK